jgi:hypothetical protein
MKCIANTLLPALLVLFVFFAHAQPDRWQQHIKYNIDIKMDVVSNKFTGVEKIEYINNSPDTLSKLFIHLYWNAFQPNSEMDVRSRELGKNIFTNRRGQEVQDWDSRVRDRISKLSESEIGYDSVDYVKVNGIAQKLLYHETILEVRLDKPLLPKSKTVVDISFRSQVPLQIRRSGRDNAEGVRYSMSQWYPKVAEYDYQGWNANPYIAREFYGVWGDYDVKITIDKSYMVAATGVLQSPNSIGFGYETGGIKVLPTPSPTHTWNFKGENIHDFVWAADLQYKHISRKVRNDLTLHAFYKAGDVHTDSAWNNLLWSAEQVLPFIEKKFGKYAYPQYSFIQGGDGGMEYAMATLIKSASLGTVFHEWMHSWYQHMLGTNESLFPWMDEGFTSYADEELNAYYYDSVIMKSPFINAYGKKTSREYELAQQNKLPLHQAGSYEGYFGLAKSGLEEPMSTHSDHYNTNYAYSSAAYAKGAVFLAQLGYIVGDNVRDRILMEYYKQWKFKHPNANDFMRVAEKVSGLALQWYKEYWVYSTKAIDYAVGDINAEEGSTVITIKRLGKMPMPVDVLLIFKDGTKEMHSIPLDLMFGNKFPEIDGTITDKEWRWTHPEYQLITKRSIKDLKSIEIDPTQRMADVNRSNNKLVIPD